MEYRGNCNVMNRDPVPARSAASRRTAVSSHGSPFCGAFARQLPLAVAFLPLLVFLWAITHRYQGFARDGELYAMQAFARLEPQLLSDLYLQNTSQDAFTLFSPLYASLMRVLGLQGAELTLFLVSTAGFLAATWLLARKLWNESIAWLTVALFIITVGYYGAYQIFSYSENYLTARSVAEALIVAAIACHYHGPRWLALMMAAGSMLIHPLMTLPGLMLLAFLWLPTWAAAAAAAAAGAAALLVSLAASFHPSGLPSLTVMDPAWLEVVRERSQFLFLNHWTASDWETAARPFVCLILAALVTPRQSVRRLCLAAMLVGACGLAVAAVASMVGPVALLLQGQAWRWMWITGFVSVLLIVPTALAVWKEKRCGPLCALLLLAGWTYGDVDGLACAEGALILWMARDFVTPNISRLLGFAAWALAAIVVAAVLGNFHRAAVTSIVEPGRVAMLIARIREAFGLGMTSVLLVVPCWLWLTKDRRPLIHAGVAAVFLVAAAMVLPGSVRQWRTAGTSAEIDEFRDWRAVIPPRSNVLTIPGTKSAAFAWFTLQRPSYLSVDQSAGVVYSPLTAQEVRRRSEVLLPVSEPDWRILTQIEQSRAGTRKKDREPAKLTAAALEDICRDPQLGFVIAAENVGFHPLTHHHPGNWNDWNLYDCRRVRDEVPSA